MNYIDITNININANNLDNDTKYVSIDIMGGLGNQLYQIGMILSYLRKINNTKKLVFKYDENLPCHYNLPRKTLWKTLLKDRFNVISESEYNKIPFQRYREIDHHKYFDLPQTNDHLHFHGYFQAIQYIDDETRKELIEHVYSNEDYMYRAYEKYNEIKRFFGDDTKDDEIITLHFRRTDFILLQTFNYNLELDYYKKALEIANKKKLVIFSDDIQWCKDNINKTLYEYDKIYYVDINDVELEFILMTLFNNKIIANSTFSLMASFISNYDKNNIVIAPKNWYGPSGPKEWSQIYHKYITHII